MGTIIICTIFKLKEIVPGIIRKHKGRLPDELPFQFFYFSVCRRKSRKTEIIHKKKQTKRCTQVNAACDCCFMFTASRHNA